MAWTRTPEGTPVNRIGGRTDPLYKVGHIVYLRSPNGICEMTVKSRWYWLCESQAFIRRRVYNAAMRHSGCGVDPALTDPVLRELGESIGDQLVVGFYQVLNHDDVFIPWSALDPSWEGASKYPPVFDDAAEWPTIEQSEAVKPRQ